jgi:hypothetical protein
MVMANFLGEGLEFAGEIEYSNYAGKAAKSNIAYSRRE